MKAKITITCIIVIGLLTGAFINFVSERKPIDIGVYRSNTEIFTINSLGSVYYLHPKIEIEFKSGNKFDVSFIFSELGFNAQGSYRSAFGTLSLRPEDHVKMVKAGRQLTFVEELLISKGRVMANDNFKYHLLPDGSMVVFMEYSAMFLLPD